MISHNGLCFKQDESSRSNRVEEVDSEKIEEQVVDKIETKRDKESQNCPKNEQKNEFCNSCQKSLGLLTLKNLLQNENDSVRKHWKGTTLKGK